MPQDYKWNLSHLGDGTFLSRIPALSMEMQFKSSFPQRYFSSTCWPQHIWTIKCRNRVKGMIGQFYPSSLLEGLILNTASFNMYAHFKVPGSWQPKAEAKNNNSNYTNHPGGLWGFFWLILDFVGFFFFFIKNAVALIFFSIWGKLLR